VCVDILTTKKKSSVHLDVWGPLCWVRSCRGSCVWGKRNDCAALLWVWGGYAGRSPGLPLVWVLWFRWRFSLCSMVGECQRYFFWCPTVLKLARTWVLYTWCSPKTFKAHQQSLRSANIWPDLSAYGTLLFPLQSQSHITAHKKGACACVRACVCVCVICTHRSILCGVSLDRLFLWVKLLGQNNIHIKLWLNLYIFKVGLHKKACISLQSPPHRVQDRAHSPCLATICL
jgi:hypothetical protein